jgi:DinB superfamily
MQTTSTRRRLLLSVSGVLPLFSHASRGQNTAPAPETASVLNKHMDWMEHAFVPAAEAMPEDKFFWAPKIGEFQGVRSFAEQILHVAELNFVLSAAILGEKPPAETDLPGQNPETMKTRFAVLKYLKDSFAFTHKALSSITEQNARLPVKHPIFDMITSRLGLGIVTIAHPFNHYGQMVEYLRMNNIVPPASRQ